MKKILILLFVFAYGLSQAQTIPIPLSNREITETIKDTVVIVAVLPDIAGQEDSFLVANREYPAFIGENGFATMAQIDKKWSNRLDNLKSANTEQSDTIWVYDNTKYFALLENRYGVVLFMKGKQQVKTFAEKTIIEKLHWLYWYAFDKGYSISQYRNNQQVKDLLNELNPIVIPETPQDSI